MSRSKILSMMALDSKYQSYKSRYIYFCANSHRFRYIVFSIFNLRKVGQGRGVQFLQEFVGQF